MNLPELVQVLRFTSEGLEQLQGDTSKALSAIGSSVDDFGKTLGKGVTKSITGAFKGVGNVLGTVAGDIVSFGKTVAVSGTAGMLAFGEQSVKTALRVQEMDTVLGILGKNAGISKDAIDASVAGVRKYGIEMGVAQDLVAQFTRGQMDVTKATDLARTAQDLAVVTGQNSSETLQQLLYGLQTGNTQLDVFQKLNFRAGDALEAYAKANHKAVKDLTQTERQQALLNGVLEAGTSIQGVYAAAMESPGKQMRSWPRYINDIQVALGAKFVPAIGDVIKPISEFLKAIGSLVTDGGALSPIIDTLAGAFGKLTTPLGGAITGITDFLTNIKPEQVEMLNGFLQKGIDLIGKWGPMFVGIIGSVGSSFAKNIPIIGQFLPTISPITGILIGLVGASDLAQGALADLGAELLSTGVSLKPIAQAFGALAKALGDTLGRIIQTVTPDIVKLLDLFNKNAATVIGDIGEALGGIGDGLGLILDGGLKVVTGLMDTLLPIIHDLAPLVADLARAFGGLINAGLSALVKPLQDIATAGGDLAKQVLPILTTLLDDLHEPLQKLLTVLGGGIAALVTALGDALVTIAPTVKLILDNGLATVTGILETLGNVLPPIVPLVADFAVAVGSLVAAGLEKIGPPLESIVTSAGKLISAILPVLTDLLSGLGPIVMGLASGALNVIADVFKTIAEHADILAPAIVAVAAAIGAMKVIDEVKDGFLTFVSGFTGLQVNTISEAGTALQAFGEQAGGAGGMAKNFASNLIGMAGPMIAVTAVTALATWAIMDYTKRKEEQKKITKDFTNAINDETGALSDNVDATVKKTVEDKHQADDLAKLGISYDTYIAAVNGSNDALRQVMEAQMKHQKIGEGLQVTVQGMNGTDREYADTNRTVAEEMINRTVAQGKLAQTTDMAIQGNRELVQGIFQQRQALKDNAEQLITNAQNNHDITDAEAEHYRELLKVKDGTVDYKSILQQLQDAEKSHGQAAKDNAKAVETTAQNFDDATAKADAYGSALDRLLGRNLSAEQSSLQLQKSFEDLTASFTVHGEATEDEIKRTEDFKNSMGTFGDTIDASGNKVRDFTTEGKIKFSEMADEITRNAETQLKNGEAVDVVKQKYEEQKASLVDTFAMMGIGRDQAQAYADTLLGTPDQITTMFDATSSDAEKARVQAYVDSIKNIPDDKKTAIKAAMDEGDLAKVYSILADLGIPQETIDHLKLMGADEAKTSINSLTGDQGEANIGVNVEKPTKTATKDIKTVATTNYGDAEIGTTTPELNQAKSDIKTVADASYPAEIDPITTPSLSTTDTAINNVASKDREAQIDVSAPQSQSVMTLIDNVANKYRLATINVQATNVDNVQRQFDNLAKTQQKTINVVTNQAPGLATGGPAWAGRMYLIGEKGPELFVPEQNGTVLPAHDPMSRAAARMGALQFVEPAPVASLKPLQTSVGGSVTTNNKAFNVAQMNIYQDLDLELAMTRMGMALDGSRL